MKTYEVNVQEPYATYIKEGSKTIEGRLNKGKFSEMKTGDEIILNQEIKLKVLDRKIYPSFALMIEREGVEKIIPHAKNIEEAVAVYRMFYTEEDEEKFGVVAIHILPI